MRAEQREERASRSPEGSIAANRSQELAGERRAETLTQEACHSTCKNDRSYIDFNVDDCPEHSKYFYVSVSGRSRATGIAAWKRLVIRAMLLCKIRPCWNALARRV